MAHCLNGTFKFLLGGFLLYSSLKVFSSGYSFFLAWRLWHFQTLVHLHHTGVLQNVMWIIKCEIVPFLWHPRQKQWATGSWLALFDRCMTAHLNPGFTSYQCDSRGNWANTEVGHDDITSRREKTSEETHDELRHVFHNGRKDWCKYTLIQQCHTLWAQTCKTIVMYSERKQCADQLDGQNSQL